MDYDRAMSVGALSIDQNIIISSDQFLEQVTEPDEASLLPAVRLFLAGNLNCIVALGGGALIDSAKANWPAR